MNKRGILDLSTFQTQKEIDEASKSKDKKKILQEKLKPFESPYGVVKLPKELKGEE